MVHRLGDGALQLTVLNFSGERVSGSVRSEHLPSGATVTDMFTGEEVATVDDLHSFGARARRLPGDVAARAGLALLVAVRRWARTA